MAGQVSIQRKSRFGEHSSLGCIGIASGAFIAAFVGAILRGQLAIWANTELAWLTIGVGVIAGLATRLLAGNEQSISIHMVAARAALIGVVVGNYYILPFY